MNMSNNEIWKQVQYKDIKYPNYFISNFGNLSKWDEKKQKWSLMKGHKNTTSNKSHKFYDFRIKNKHLASHILVAEAFIPLNENPPYEKKLWDITPIIAKKLIRDGLLIDHIDNNPFNNHVSNLRWATPQENNKHYKIKNFQN